MMKIKSNITNNLTNVNVDHVSTFDKFLINHKLDIIFLMLSLLLYYKVYQSLILGKFDSLRMFFIIISIGMTLMLLSSLISSFLKWYDKKM
jgi:hypothetical protein